MSLLPWQIDLWQRLTRLRSRLPHVILLKGSRGTGKFSLGRIWAKSLLCEQPQEKGLPCGNCPACNWFEQGAPGFSSRGAGIGRRNRREGGQAKRSNSTLASSKFETRRFPEHCLASGRLSGGRHSSRRSHERGGRNACRNPGRARTRTLFVWYPIGPNGFSPI